MHIDLVFSDWIDGFIVMDLHFITLILIDLAAGLH